LKEWKKGHEGIENEERVLRTIPPRIGWFTLGGRIINLYTFENTIKRNLKGIKFSYCQAFVGGGG